MLNFPLTSIKGIWRKNISGLRKLGLLTVKDLLFYFPTKYKDFSKVKKISRLKIGEEVVIKGKIVKTELKKTPKKRRTIFEIIVDDGSGLIKGVWFGKLYLSKILKENQVIYLAGKTYFDKYGFYFLEPIYEFESQLKIHLARIVPFYKETKGITSRYLRYLIQKILPLARKIEEPLPKEILRKYHLPEKSQAISWLHQPKNFLQIKLAQKRFDFENLFLFQLLLTLKKRSLKKYLSPKIEIDKNFLNQILNSLPFKLTFDQTKALFEILSDFKKSYPSNRLLEGDVGSGKTIVALIASMVVLKNKYQVAVLVPTEILAYQHFQTAIKFFSNFNFNFGLLLSKNCRIFSGGESAKVKKESLKREIKEGEIDLVFGTHALLYEEVSFKSLGFVVIDEQHRFGVKQRKKLTYQKDVLPHFLSMTATPIPRTLALAVYADLDLSIIKQMPKKRKVITKIVAQEGRSKVYQFIKEEIKKGSKVFVVCPLIEESKVLEAESVTKQYEKLKKFFSEEILGVLYGKMKPEEKQNVIKNFIEGKIKILISTSVVEVGIDIPEANIMIIEGAQQFGLASLHQIRGRIGRGGKMGFCFLFCDKLTPSVKKRLKAIQEAKDGFELAKKDLEIRGPGEVLGKKQHGLPDRIMKVLNDPEILKLSKEGIDFILKKDCALTQYPFLKKAILEIGDSVHLE
ncbi:ATP-dependent DNA helicase RecG [bacterium]|nr:ATP-dependent DNA helicase RecG [bacterium]